MTDGTRVNIRTSAIELAEYLKEHPEDIDRAEYNIGFQYLAVYFNEQFKLQSDEHRELMIESILRCIEDLSTGGEQLRAGMMGLQFYENKVEHFVSTHESQPLGTMVFRIAIKHLIAFQAWRTREGEELPQLQTNCAVYCLVVLLSNYL